jgi:hypothetical protein
MKIDGVFVELGDIIISADVLISELAYVYFNREFWCATIMFKTGVNIQVNISDGRRIDDFDDVYKWYTDEFLPEFKTAFLELREVFNQ